MQRRSVIELEIRTHDRHRRIGDRHVGVVQIYLSDGARNGLYRRGKSKCRGRADIDPVDVSDCRVCLEFESTVGSAQNDATTRDRNLIAHMTAYDGWTPGVGTADDHAILVKSGARRNRDTLEYVPCYAGDNIRPG